MRSLILDRIKDRIKIRWILGSREHIEWIQIEETTCIFLGVFLQVNISLISNPWDLQILCSWPRETLGQCLWKALPSLFGFHNFDKEIKFVIKLQCMAWLFLRGDKIVGGEMSFMLDRWWFIILITLSLSTHLFIGTKNVDQKNRSWNYFSCLPIFSTFSISWWVVSLCLGLILVKLHSWENL